MQDFVNYIYDFILSILNAVYNRVSINGTNQTAIDSYNSWINRQIISGDLINIGLTWRELLLYIATYFLIIFFIVFVVRFILKLFGLFKIW